MNKWLTFCLVLLCVNFAAGQPALSFDDLMKRGVQAYKTSHYAEAQEVFEKAVALDPKNVTALNYLASAFQIQWVPGVNSPQNLQNYQQARATFLRVLRVEPDNTLALTALASLAYNNAFTAIAKDKQFALDEARGWNLRRLQADPNQAEAPYYLRVIVWAQCFPQIQSLRIESRLSPADVRPLPEGPAKQNLRDACAQEIEEGIYYLRHALDLNPQLDDAMSYLNLMYRLKADLAVSPAAASSLLEEARQWSERSLEAKRKKDATVQH